MSYVIDTSAFIVLNHFYPATFPSLWERLESLVGQGAVFSVKEVLNELSQYNAESSILDWARRHRGMFAKPSNEELLVVQQILAVPHFQTLISSKALLKGTPVADPFFVAAAKVREGTVVTVEKAKPNAAKIPNVCSHFKVPCIDLKAFMDQQGWVF